MASYTHTYSVYTLTYSLTLDKHIPYERAIGQDTAQSTGDNSVSSHSLTPQVNLEPVVPPDGARMTTGIVTAPGSWADLSRSFSVRPHFTLYTFGLDVRKYSV